MKRLLSAVLAAAFVFGAAAHADACILKIKVKNSLETNINVYKVKWQHKNALTIAEYTVDETIKKGDRKKVYEIHAAVGDDAKGKVTIYYTKNTGGDIEKSSGYQKCSKDYNFRLK